MSAWAEYRLPYLSCIINQESFLTGSFPCGLLHVEEPARFATQEKNALVLGCQCWFQGPTVHNRAARLSVEHTKHNLPFLLVENQNKQHSEERKCSKKYFKEKPRKTTHLKIPH